MTGAGIVIAIAGVSLALMGSSILKNHSDSAIVGLPFIAAGVMLASIGAGMALIGGGQ